MSGFVGNLSAKQKEALQRFRAQLADVWRPDFDADHYLLRWLRARNFDVKKAEKMLRAHLAFRREFGADSILEEYTPDAVIDTYYPGGFCGRNKAGQPLWVDPTGHCDMKGLVKSVSLFDIIRSRVFLLEHIHRVLLPKRSKEAGKLIEQTVVIFDLEHFGMRHMWKPGMDVFLELTRILEANYPETMGTCYVVNAPSFFPALYQLVKPFLHEETQKKVQVLGANYRETLLRYFDPAHLPARYGGEMRDPDGSPDCRTWIGYGGDIPAHLYLTCDRSEMESQLVPRGSTLKLEVSVAAAGARLSWVFSTDDHDLGFGVFVKSGDSQRSRDWEPVVETRRVNCHLRAERGRLVCPAPGAYVLRFDNSFSWTRAKRVWYLVSVDAGGAEAEEVRVNGRCQRPASLDRQASGSDESFHSARSHLST